MPQLIRTLNQIMREERKDAYFVRFHGQGRWSDDDAKARERLLAWLRESLPGTLIEITCPDGISGVDPRQADIRIDFDKDGLARFCARWEEPDGTSLDPHFQCYIWPFADWRAGIADSMPTFDRPAVPVACWFWDTPKGFLHHPAPPSGRSFVVDTANPDDVWFLAGELAPEWRDMDMADFVGGRIDLDVEKQQWRVYIGFFSHRHFDHCQRNDDYRMKPENQRRICEWFGLPPERVVFEELSDY